MADTNFIDKTTYIEADWLNDVNDVVYTDLGGAGGISSTATGKGASLVGFEPSGDIASTDVQAALEELDSEKLPVITASTADSNKDALRLQVNGVTALKALIPVSGERVWLNYHTSEGDGGHGVFRGITGAAPGTYTDDNGVTILPTGGDGSSCWQRETNGFIHVGMFGLVANGVDDDYEAIAAAIAAAANGKLVFPANKTIRYTQPLVFSGLDVDFNGCTMLYDGATGVFALSLVSSAGGGVSQTVGNEFKNFTLRQEDFSEYVTYSDSFTITPPAIPAFANITNITPNPVSTEVTVVGARQGGYALATFSNDLDGIDISAEVTADDTVTVYFNSYKATTETPTSGTLTVTVVNNAYHGLSIGGALGTLENFKISGFTGVSFGVGAGSCQISGVNFSASSEAYYWEVRGNVTPAAGWGAIIQPRNNVNNFTLSFFVSDFYGDDRSSCINNLVISGLGNNFTQVSLEGAPSNESLILTHASSNCSSASDIYYEVDTGRWPTPSLPNIRAKKYSSSNRFRFRIAGSVNNKIVDEGMGNLIEGAATSFINGACVLSYEGGANLVANGDFLNGTRMWSLFGTGSTLSYAAGAGAISGNSARIDVIDGQPNLLQAIDTNGVLNWGNGLTGKTVSVGAWVKTNIGGIGIRLGGQSSVTCPADEEYHFITLIGRIGADISIRELEGVNRTGYFEVSNITVVPGVSPLSHTTQGTLIGSATYNPPSIAAGATTSTTVTVSGAELGDVATASFSRSLGGLVMLQPEVSAADTVTVTLWNPTAGAIDIGSGTLRVKVTKA